MWSSWGAGSRGRGLAGHPGASADGQSSGPGRRPADEPSAGGWMSVGAPWSSCGLMWNSCGLMLDSCGLMLDSCGLMLNSCELMLDSCGLMWNSCALMWNSCALMWNSCGLMLISCGAHVDCDGYFPPLVLSGRGPTAKSGAEAGGPAKPRWCPTDTGRSGSAQECAQQLRASRGCLPRRGSSGSFCTAILGWWQWKLQGWYTLHTTCTYSAESFLRWTLGQVWASPTLALNLGVLDLT